jgi:phosphatidylinositol alpha 1,6-mannosyltransferase
MWADDKVHFRSKGHRFVAYRAAEALGVPYADELANLDSAFHDDDTPNPRGWVRRDAAPWLWRRLRGRTAGDGLSAKHADYVTISRRPISTPPPLVAPDSGPRPVQQSPERRPVDPVRPARP